MRWMTRVPHLPSKEPLLLGVYAWSLTIASPSLEDRASVVARVLAGSAFFVFIVGWFALDRLPRIADALAVFAFCGLNVCTLVVLGPGRLGLRAPTVQLAMGAVVWCLFSISWARARNLARGVAARLGNTLDMTPTPADPLSSQLAIGLLGFCAAGIIGLYGAPSMDGHGVLIVALVIVGSLRLTATAGSLISRIEQASARRRHLATVAPEHRD